MTTKIRKIVNGRALARNSIINLIGLVVPVVVAFAAVPRLISTLGTDRFGVLNLIWLVIGYFSLFDMGLSRAITKFVAEKIESGVVAEKEIPQIVTTGISIMMFMGIIGTVVSLLISSRLVYSILKVPPSLQVETLEAFYLLSFSLPIVITTAGLRGILEAYQRFDWVNIIRVPMGIFNYVGPLVAVLISNSLVTVVSVLFIGRALAWGVHLWYCLKLVPGMRFHYKVQKNIASGLIRFGSWLTVSGIIAPLMSSLDRFMLGAVVSVQAVAYYAAPYEMVTKMWLIPTALTGVLFPAFASSFDHVPEYCGVLFNRGVKYTFLALFPIVLIIVTLANEGMTLWLGKEFSSHSYQVLQLLAVGILINSLAHIPHALICGSGRPDLVSKLHIVELPLYLMAAWYLTRLHGINGMAMAWTLRVIVDSLVMFIMVRWFLPKNHLASRTMLLIMAIPFSLLVIGAMPMGIAVKVAFLCSVLVVFALIAWKLFLVQEEKALALNLLSISGAFSYFSSRLNHRKTFP